MAERFTTASQVTTIKPPATGRVEHWDRDVPGLGLRVTASGRKTWFFRFRKDGRYERLTLGPFPALTLADARDQARDLERQTAHGANPAEARRGHKRAETFAEVAKRYLDEHAKPNKRSWTRDQQILNRDVLPRIGRLKAKDVRRADVKAVLRAILQRGAPIGANRTLEVIRQVFNWALREEVGDVLANPCAMMRPPGQERSRERALGDEEIASVWRSLDHAHMAPAARTALRVLLVTAQRKGELCKAEWRDIDRPSALWTIRAEIAKNGMAHRVPLSPLALSLFDELRARAGGSPFVLPMAGGARHVGDNCLNNALYRVRATFGVAPFNAHDLRRTAATGMARLGVSRATIAHVLNHLDPHVTAIYDRYSYDREKREALDLWADHLRALIDDRPTGNVIRLRRR